VRTREVIRQETKVTEARQPLTGLTRAYAGSNDSVLNSGPLRILGTSLRSRPAAQTLRTAVRLLARLGVSQLKGLSATDAHTGAAMEALEFAVSESASASASCAVQHCSLGELTGQWPESLGVVDFAPRLGVRLSPRARLPSVECEVLTTRRRVLLPAELVLWPSPPQRMPLLFGNSTNGLAAGNTLEEATLHALLEVLERDTVALHMARDESAALALTTMPDPFAGLAQTWRRRGVRLYVRHLPNALGLPCFQAGLHDPAQRDDAPALAFGWGIHFDRQIALSRAVCEAAQSRLAVILSRRPGQPGATEMASRLGVPPPPQHTARLLARLSSRGRRVRFEALPSAEPRSIGVALNSLLSRLPEAGFGPAFRHRLHVDADATRRLGLHVVKVVLARSETPVGAHPRIGPRLLARLQGG